MFKVWRGDCVRDVYGVIAVGVRGGRGKEGYGVVAGYGRMLASASDCGAR